MKLTVLYVLQKRKGWSYGS